METRLKKQRIFELRVQSKPSWLNLHAFGIPKDLRIFLYSYISHSFRCVIEISHTLERSDVQKQVTRLKRKGVVSVRLLKCGAFVRYGHLSLIKRFFDKGYKFFDSSTWMSIAAKHGQLDILKWCKLIGLQYSKKYMLLRSAVQNGHKNVVKYILRTDSNREFFKTHDGRELELAANEAAARNQFEVLKLFEEYVVFSPITFRHAVSSQNMEMLEYLLELGCGKDSCVTSTLAGTGNVALANWLLERGIVFTNRILPFAARKGRLEMVKWCFEADVVVVNQVACNKALEYASKTGNADVVNYLRAKGAAFSPTCFEKCAQSGNFEMLKMYYEQGCPFNVRASYAVARYGTLDVLKWLASINCPFDNRTFSCACHEDKLDMVTYLFQNLDMFNMSMVLLDESVRVAAIAGNVEVLDFLLTAKVSVHAMMFYEVCAFGKSRYTTLKYLLGKRLLNGEPMPKCNITGRKDCVLRFCRLDTDYYLLKLLLKHGFPFDKVKCEEVAENNNNFHSLALLKRY